MLFTLSIILKNHMNWSENASTAEFHVGRSAQHASRRDHTESGFCTLVNSQPRISFLWPQTRETFQISIHFKTKYI